MSQTRSLGIGFSPLERRRELIVELAVLAERCGYDRVSLGEGWTWEVHLVLAEIAAKTRKLELVSAVVSAYSRTPGSIAMSAATLAAQSGGRYVLGLGASSQALTEGFHDVAYTQPVTQLRTTVEDTRALLTGGRIEMTRDVRPLRLGVDDAPSVPIYIAALSPRALRLVGGLAEGWLPFLVPPAQLPAFVDEIDRGRSGRSSDLDSAIRVLPAVPTVVSADAARARGVMSATLTTYLLAMGEFYGPFLEGIGFGTEVAAIRAANARPGDGIIPEAGERLLREQTIVGTPEEARARLVEWYEAGADAPLLTLPPGAPADLLRETVEVMAPGA
jgi:alkanesulfonate monooxygenase SsuD/methylene tetrahydromethanopterin reductase-like flavin-dependent oxidoreductase (luciferase family)